MTNTLKKKKRKEQSKNHQIASCVIEANRVFQNLFQFVCGCVRVCVFVCTGSWCEVYCFISKIYFLLRFMVKNVWKATGRVIVMCFCHLQYTVIQKCNPYYAVCIWVPRAGTDEKWLSKYAKSTRILASGILNCQNQQSKSAWQAQHLSWCQFWTSHIALKIGWVVKLDFTSIVISHPSSLLLFPECLQGYERSLDLLQ